ncbi:MAG: hypothetical protein RLZZ597_3796 [Cyanobacteriota bacterium]|jgi:hypothetical protein
MILVDLEKIVYSDRYMTNSSVNNPVIFLGDCAKPTINRPTLVAARLPVDLAEALDAERRRRGVPKSEVIFLALQEFLGKN